MGPKTWRAALAAASILCSLLHSAPAVAAIPRILTYQGHLANAASVPVNAPTDITVSLFTVASGGVAAYAETFSAVPVSNGTFTVVLGANALHPLPADFSGPYFLEVAAGNPAETLAPRQALTASPYALQADGLAVTATVPVAQIGGGTAAIDISGTAQNGARDVCLLYTSPSPRDRQKSRMPSSA